MTTFVYLHGFNSVYDPENEKVTTLSKLGKVIGITYNTLDTYANINKFLEDELQKLKINSEEFVLVGTSLGGFWAAEMAAHFGVPSVIINPCYDPTNMLAKYIGPQKNHKTGVESTFEEISVSSYQNMKTADRHFDFIPLVLLDLGDEVIDSHKSLEHFASFGNAVVFADGNHRFAHMEQSLPFISEYQNYCSFMEDLNV